MPPALTDPRPLLEILDLPMGWIHRLLHSFVTCMQCFPESSLVAGTGIEPGSLTPEVCTIPLHQQSQVKNIINSGKSLDS